MLKIQEERWIRPDDKKPRLIGDQSSPKISGVAEMNIDGYFREKLQLAHQGEVKAFQTIIYRGSYGLSFD